MCVHVNVHTCINGFQSPGCLLVCAPPLNTCARVEAEGRWGQTEAEGFRDGCEECSPGGNDGDGLG